MVKLTKLALVIIKYEIDLSRYTVAELKQMYKDGVITKNEMNDELDSRSEAAMYATQSAS